jgi:ATP-dependent helicase/nuclease subunit A
MRTEHVSIPDAEARRLAETTFDRNIVVAAGAGTGKTTLLVNRFVHVLMRDPAPVEVTRVVALTFTNKAATEMKVRLRERLLALLHPGACGGDGDSGRVRAADLRAYYGVSNETIASRARAALDNLEKAQIGTLHSFAAHLLRLYPIESGVDPVFKEDEGLRFEGHFTERWDLWLDRELGAEGTNHPRWREVLAAIALEEVREVAWALCSELVPLEELIRQVEGDTLTPALREWFEAVHDRASRLLAAHPMEKKPRNVERALAAALQAFRTLLEQGLPGRAALSKPIVEELGKDPGKCPRGWEAADFAEAKRVIQVAERALSVDAAFWRTLLDLLAPFVAQTRETFVGEGWISFDGLLARARALLRDHPAVRERLKGQYEAILVDEFQDTDPAQYEILLFLAEQPGRCAGSWREVALQPGKLFIVGDPKQSIYAFRRADIEAFDRVVEKIEAAGGHVYDLVTNFRSHGRVLAVVNAAFDRLFRPQPHLQPRNVHLAVRPNRRSAATQPGVELRLVTAAGEEGLDADHARRIEAEQLAIWLKHEVLGKHTLTDEQGRVTPVQPGHVALLFRKLTQAQDYLDALRRHGIQYLTDGEKHFYRRQEVIDLINVLRVLENPHDAVAVLGVLRSPLAGLMDREIYELRERDAFDCRALHRLDGWVSPRAMVAKRLYERLADLARMSAGRPLPEVLDLVFVRLPVLELAAASLHGEQAVANLCKVRQMAADLADRPMLTLTGFVELMIARLEEQPDEAESALAEESLEAVRVLTIHKAKGLEFPVVIVPGLQQGERGGDREPVVSHDWSTGVLGLSIHDKRSLGAVLVGDKGRAREEAERRRLFYVAMTRAQERLVLSGGLVERHARGTLLSLLEEALDADIGQPGQDAVSIGTVTLCQAITAAEDRPPRVKKPSRPELRPAPEVTDLLRRWQARDLAWGQACSSRLTLTPSLLIKEERAEGRPAGGGPGEADRARLIGTLAHRVLEEWDFQAERSGLLNRINRVCQTGIPKELADAGDTIRDDLRDMLTAFAESPPYAELRRATILGREVPFAIKWTAEGLGARGQGHETTGERHEASGERHRRLETDSAPLPLAPCPAPCIMTGIIDLIYRLDGRLWIADYKTDRLTLAEMPERVATYRPQARAYLQAVVDALGERPAGFNFVFLRSGQMVPVQPDASPC